MDQRVEAPSYNKRDVEDDGDEVMSDEEVCVPEDVKDEDEDSQSQDPDALLQKRYAKRSPVDLPSARAAKGSTKDTQTPPSSEPVVRTIKTTNPPRKPSPGKYDNKPKTESK